MSQTMHDLIKEALIKEAIYNDNFVELVGRNYPTPEKYKRMWKKITGKDITLEQARKAMEN